MFSSRTNWHPEHNRLTGLLELRRKNNKPIYDLTVSNPTESGIQYPEHEFLSALAQHQSLTYQPNPRGLYSARDSIAQNYRVKNITVDPSDIFLTASTSEAYSLIIKVLCNGGEHILVPQPSYPLFEYLAQINDAGLQHYHLFYDHGWNIDIDSIREAITPSTRAITIVNPHNPTGMFIKKAEYQQIQELARQHQLSLIVDEVFIDYAFKDDENRYGSTPRETDILTFTLNGISKTIGLPQMKLGWIIVSGEQTIVTGAIKRLEILCDTFLSVNTPVQIALPKFFEFGKSVQRQIFERITSNYGFAKEVVQNSPCTLLPAEGGWYATILVPKTMSDEEWAIELLNTCGVYLFPGYFFDFEVDGRLVVSLLTQPEIFAPAVNELVRHVSMR